MAPRNNNSQHEYGASLQHEPEFSGPRGRRSCTDVLCLLLFVIALAAWGVVGRYAYTHGDPNRLIVPADSNGRRCGQDSEVINKPNLLFFDLTQCASPKVWLDGCTTTQICLKDCPKKAWSAYIYIKNPDRFDVADVKNNLICTSGDISASVTDVNKLKKVVESGLCAPWQLPSKPVYGRCLPSFDEIKNVTDILSTAETTIDDIRYSSEVVQKLSTVNEIVERIIEDLMHTWRYLVIGLVLAMVISLIYITMLRWIAGLMVWLSLLGITVLLGLGIYVCYGRYRYFSSLPEESPLPPGRQTLRTRINDFFEKKSTWLGLTIFSCVLFVIVILVLVFLRQRINIAITLIKEGSKAVGSVISALFFPVFPWIFELLVVAYFGVTCVYLTSIGRNTFKVYGVDKNPNCECANNFYKDRDFCTVEEFNSHCSNPVGGGSCLKAGCNFVALESDSFITYLQLYNLFVMFWGVWFLAGLAQMILAATFATWYWTFHKRDLPFFTLTASIYRSIRYHLGTVAFGSLIIAICSFLRTLIEFVELKLKKYDNAFTKAVFCLLKCFFWCLHKFICYINTNAYIMCAIHGKNFCSSAQEAFFLLMRNVIRVVVVDKVTDFLFFLGKVVITAAVMVGAYFVFRGPVRLLNNTGIDVQLNYVFVPVIALGVGTYLIASIFFGVYAMAVDTLFLCFLEDCERNDGSPDRPYFMSKKLMKILGKKNKKT